MVLSLNLFFENLNPLSSPVSSESAKGGTEVVDSLNTLSPLLATKRLLETMTVEEIRDLVGLRDFQEAQLDTELSKERPEEFNLPKVLGKKKKKKWRA